jgi:hypothetical protein
MPDRRLRRRRNDSDAISQGGERVEMGPHEDLAIEIRETLEKDPHTRRRQVETIATSSGILLRGEVHTYFLKQMAQEVAKRTINGSLGTFVRLRNEIEVENSDLR